MRIKKGETMDINLKTTKKLLIIVDMINGFLKQGALADTGIQKITAENVNLAKAFLKSGGVIAFKDCHNENSPEFLSFPAHCLKGTIESELIDELKIFEKDIIVFEKNSTNGFVVPEFYEFIKKMTNIEEIVITGCCTDICIMNLAIPLKNFYNQLNKNVEIIVPKNAVDTYDIPNVHSRDEWNAMAFKFMAQAGIKIVDKLSNNSI